MDVEGTTEEYLVDSFLTVAVGQTPESAYFFLNSANWNLERALQLCFARSDNDNLAYPPPSPPRRPELYRHASTAAKYLVKPPRGLAYKGSFFMAMLEAARQGRWLLVNIQSAQELDSHSLNKDTWSDTAVVDMIKSKFLFFQVEKREEGKGAKVASFYNLSSLPAIMVVDPVTGEKKWAVHGMIDAATLISNLSTFAENPLPDEYKHLNVGCPKYKLEELEEEDTADQTAFYSPDHDLVENTMETYCTSSYGWGEEFEDEDCEIGGASDWIAPEYEYPTLPTEPSDDQKRETVCKIGIRLPDGRRVQRRFNKSDPIQLLWSFGQTVLPEELKNSAFRFVEALPGKLRKLEYEQEGSFEEERLNNTMLSLEMDVYKF